MYCFLREMVLTLVVVLSYSMKLELSDATLPAEMTTSREDGSLVLQEEVFIHPEIAVSVVPLKKNETIHLESDIPQTGPVYEHKVSFQERLIYLKEKDAELNMTFYTAWNLTRQFLSTADLKAGEKSMRKMGDYVEGRNDWIEDMKELWMTKPDNESRSVMLRDGTLLHGRVQELNNSWIILNTTRTVYALERNYHILNKIDIVGGKDLNDKFFDTGEYHVRLKVLDSVINLLLELTVAARAMLQMRPSNDTPGVANFTARLLAVASTKQEALIVERDKLLTELHTGIIFRDFVDPVVYSLVLLFGFIWNGTLILVFAKHREVRTSSNSMLFSLALVDILNLFINAPVYFISKYYSPSLYLGEYACRAYTCLRIAFRLAIEFSLLGLCVQRYTATLASWRKLAKKTTLSTWTRAIIWIIAIWVISFLVALPASVMFEFPEGVCFPFVKHPGIVEYMLVFYFILSIIALPLPILVLSVLTARRLRRSVRNMPGAVQGHGGQEIARVRSANVVTALAVLFTLTHIPRPFWFGVVSWTHINRRRVAYFCIDETFSYLYFLNSCLNPVAIYFASGTFRRLFNKYLFRSCTRTGNDALIGNAHRLSSGSVVSIASAKGVIR